MKRFLVVLSVSVILFAARLEAQPESPAVGIVSRISGRVLIERGKTSAAARLADLLYANDRVVASEGQADILFCPSSEKMTLMNGTTVELGAERARVVKGVEPKKTPARCLLPRVALGSESLERMGGLRARGGAAIPLYTGGVISSARPEFCWGAIQDAEIYRVTLKDTKRFQVIWEQSTASLRIAYPDSLAPLAGAEYEWEVRAEANARTLATGTAAIEVKPDSALTNATSTASEESLVRAIELENRGYYAEAATFFRAAREKNAEDKRLTQHLAWLYWNSGLINAFNEELKRLADPPKQ